MLSWGRNHLPLIVLLLAVSLHGVVVLAQVDAEQPAPPVEVDETIESPLADDAEPEQLRGPEEAVAEDAPADEAPADDPREAGGDPVENEAAERAALETLVDAVVRSQQREHGLAAVTVSLVRGDELWLARGYGLADLETERPVVPEETLFRIGSVSKTFTWTAVMMLSERGLIDLDADVNGYLRDVRVDDAFGRPVTMRELMSHRAGFEDTLLIFTVADDDPRSLAELLSEHQPRRVFEPGARTAYSNWGAALAAQMVEDVAGVPYGDFVQTELLDPLGMEATTWQPPGAMEPALRQRLATGYRPARGGLEPQDYLQIGAYWPAGAMASTATDMARWMRFHLNGGELDGVRLVEADTHARMWTRAYDDRALAADIAHGFQDRPYRGVRTLGHAGGTAAFLTNMVLVPELGLGVFISQSSTHAPAPITQLPERVIDHLQGYLYEPALAIEDDDAALTELAGTYLPNRRVFSTFAALLGALNVAQLTPMTADAFTLSMMGRADYYRRLPQESDVFEAANGARVAVVRDERGRVAALADETGVLTLERASVLRSPYTLLAALALPVLLALSTLLGGWRRFGHNRGSGLRSRLVGTVSLVSAVVVLWFLASVAMMAAGFASFDLAAMAENYPTPAMLHTHAVGWAVGGMALAMLVALWPVWVGSRWRLWRRLHFSLFAASLLFLTLQLWLWRVIGAPVV